jgi:hypothetical protein
MDSLIKFVKSLDPAIIRHGGHFENDNQVELKAGMLSMLYENGNLRHIKIYGHEVIRMIYPALRDKTWLNVRPNITLKEFNICDNSFYIKSLYRYREEEIDFSAFLSVEGRPDNSLIVEIRGEALSSFEKNRIGFCVLHPVEETAGTDCLIKHSNNDLEILRFPVLISPHQPFTDIYVMHWNVEAISCRLDFYGDVFETEDQRNWTDASYKTYSTPLNLPYPVRLQQGDTVNQAIVLRVKPGKEVSIASDIKKYVNVCIGVAADFSETGISRSSRTESLTENEILLLKKLRFDHYRVDLYLFMPGWVETVRQAVEEASKLDYRLELVLFVDDEAEKQLDEFLKWSGSGRLSAASISVFHKETGSTPETICDSFVSRLRKSFPGAKIAAGTNANFAQLNRERPKTDNIDLICYAIHPQEHASDNLTITENLESQSHTVKSARSFAEGKGIWISPVNIQRRFNANIENYEHPAGPGLPPQVDSRLMSLFGACWLTGSIKNLFGSGVSGATFLETTGERGIIQGSYHSRWPDAFPSVTGMIFPVYFVFQFILRFKTFRIIKTESPDPLSFDMLLLSDGNRFIFILVNFTPEDQEVFPEGISGEFDIRQLNDQTYGEAAVNSEWLNESLSGMISLPGKIKLQPFSLTFGAEVVR